MPELNHATYRIVLSFLMATFFGGLIAADVFVDGYTVNIVLAAIPVVAMLVLLGERVYTPYGGAGGRKKQTDQNNRDNGGGGGM